MDLIEPCEKRNIGMRSHDATWTITGVLLMQSVATRLVMGNGPQLAKSDMLQSCQGGCDVIGEAE